MTSPREPSLIGLAGMVAGYRLQRRAATMAMEATRITARDLRRIDFLIRRGQAWLRRHERLEALRTAIDPKHPLCRMADTINKAFSVLPEGFVRASMTFDGEQHVMELCIGPRDVAIAEDGRRLGAGFLFGSPWKIGKLTKRQMQLRARREGE